MCCILVHMERVDSEIIPLTTVSQPLDNLRHCTPLLADGYVDGVELLAFVVSVVEPLLIDDSVYGNSRLTVTCVYV